MEFLQIRLHPARSAKRTRLSTRRREDAEFVPAIAEDGFFSKTRVERLGKRNQAQVANMVAELIVEILKWSLSAIANT